MKPDKSNKAPHVLLVSKRFNEVNILKLCFNKILKISVRLVDIML
jgi:hypothetical protein